MSDKTPETQNTQQPQAKGPRPGAMTMAMQAVQVKPAGPKVLRIGLIQGGKIVEERVIRKRETVTVGSSEKNHFVIHTPEPNLSVGMQALSARYTQAFNRRHRRDGSLFRGRFHAILVERESYLAPLARYVDLDGPLLLAKDREPGLRYHDSAVEAPERDLWG